MDKTDTDLAAALTELTEERRQHDETTKVLRRLYLEAEHYVATRVGEEFLRSATHQASSRLLDLHRDADQRLVDSAAVTAAEVGLPSEWGST